MNNNSIKKELEDAKIAANKCMEEKCRNIPKFKKALEVVKICHAQNKDNGITKLLECFESHKMPLKRLSELGACNVMKCNDKFDKINEISKKKIYIQFPEVAEIDKKVKQLEEEKQKCQKTHCSHIYPLNKLKKENEKSNKLIKIDESKHKKYVDKYNLNEKNNKINKCTKKSCKQIVKQIDNLNLKKIKIMSKTK